MKRFLSFMSKRSTLVKGLFVGVSLALLMSVTAVFGEAMQDGYLRTTKIQYLFGQTLTLIFWQNFGFVLVAMAVSGRIYDYMANKRYEKTTIRNMLIGFNVILFLILVNRPISLNSYYYLGGEPVSNMQMLGCQIKDMAENEYVTFKFEKCEVIRGSETNTMFQAGTRRTQTTYSYQPYVYLHNQNDSIPIDERCMKAIKELIDESGNICEITCYKNSHIITAIDGVPIASLE